MENRKLVAIIQRHGSTVLNEDNKLRSRLDPPLDNRGLEQAEEAATNLKGEDIKILRIVSSPLLRAVQTADCFAELFGLDVEQDRALISWNLGALSGKDRDEWGEILEYFIDHPKSVPPDGESLDSLELRTYEYFDKELKKDKLTLYCSHNSNIVTLETLLAGDKVGRPESSETSLQPGGTMGVYVDSEGKYSTEILFGKEKEPAFGS
jgi:broad specificity phosphatase PhoE